MKRVKKNNHGRMTTQALLEREAWTELLQGKDYTEEELAAMEKNLLAKEAETRERGQRQTKEREILEKEKKELAINMEKATEYEKLHKRRKAQFDQLDGLNEALMVEYNKQQKEREKMRGHRAVTHGSEKPMAGPIFDKLMSTVRREAQESPLSYIDREDLKDLFLCATAKNAKGEEEVVMEQFIPIEFLR